MNAAFWAISAVILAAISVHAQPHEPQPIDPVSLLRPDLTPGYVLIEGDIQIRLDQYLLLISGAPSDATFGNATFWTNNTVPFEFDDNFVVNPPNTVATGVTSLNRTRAINAMNAIESRTGLDFRPAVVGDPNRICFQNSTGNSSPVGMVGGTQMINIVSWENQIIICHELYHTLGFWHEQSRSDRDFFITINTQHICGSSSSPGNPCTPGPSPGCNDCGGSSCAHNFARNDNATRWGPYDFDSFMHYPRWAFSCTGSDTITVRPTWNAQWQNSIGQTDHFSHLDELSCRGIYPRPGDRWMRSGVQTGNGNFFSPYNSVVAMYASMPSGGTLFIDPGTYNIPIVGVPQSQPLTLRATFGPVVITSTP